MTTAVELSNDPVRIARSKLANACRKDNPTAVAEARQLLTAAKAERAIREALAASPPITYARRAELAQLLVGGSQ